MLVMPIGKDYEWTRDLATEQGEMSVRQMSIGEYLTAINVLDPETKKVNFDSDAMAVSIQRAAIKIAGNSIKERMLETILQGGVLPAKALHETEDGLRKPLILDGLQRTHVEAMGAEYLRFWEDREEDSIPDFARKIMVRNKDRLLSLDDYLNRPVFLQVWRNLSVSEQIRLFVVLNVGQQKVSMRHLLEALNKTIEGLFTKWGIITRTEKGERLHGKARAKWTGDIKLPPFRLEYLVNAARAYVEGNQHVKTKATIEETYDSGDRDKQESGLVEMGPNLVKKLMDLGDDASRGDFEWACKDLNDEVTRVYRDNPKWRLAIVDSDNFFYPLMAALGKARGQKEKHPLMDEYKEDIIRILREAEPGNDPLMLGPLTPDKDEQSLAHVLDLVRSNIGKTTRTIIYNAWKEYFRVGRSSESLVLDWAEASNR